ncbi:hypothetical protein TNCV_4300371 [Trichonephila clavipes]|nr:hypothetical protein TNCV_4300371 [Trichonephila clavipes]
MTKETSEIQFVTHNRVSAHTIRRHLRMSGMSARRSLLCLIITGNHMSLRRKWCDEQGMDNGMPSSTHYRYTEEPALYLCSVGASGPPIHSAFAINHIRAG